MCNQQSANEVQTVEMNFQTVAMDFQAFALPSSSPPTAIEQSFASDVRIIRETPMTEAERENALREARHVYTESLAAWEEEKKAKAKAIQKAFREEAERVLGLCALPARARDLFWEMAEEKADRAYDAYFNSDYGSWGETEWYSIAFEELKRCRDLANAVLGVD